MSQLEREYGVNRSTLSGWVKQLSPIRVSEDDTVTHKEFKALQCLEIPKQAPNIPPEFLNLQINL